MDCEKFDSLILDKLYGELDEVTSAAMKRHAAGCSACAEKLGGLRGTREAVALEPPDFPPGLEERILSATEEASKVVPISRGRLSRLVSAAGTWAMRPQTAMAALFLLMIGSSAVLLRTRQPKESISLTVTQEGAPSPAAAAPNEDREFDSKGAANAHGPAGAVAQATPVAAATEAPHGPVARTLLPTAPADEPNSPLGLLAQGGRAKESEAKEKKLDNGLGGMGYSGGGGASPPPPAAAPAAAPAAPGQAAKASSESRDDALTDAFQAGMSFYQARRYVEATPKLDQAAASGHPAAALWAARSVREGQGCAPAIPRFNAVANKGGATGHDAMFDAAKCYEALGDREAARSRYTTLLTVPAYASRARSALESGSEMASRKAEARPASTTQPPAAGPPVGGARAAPGKEAAPKPAPAAVDKGAAY